MRFEPKSLPNRSLAVRDQGYIYAAIALRSHIRPYYPDSTVSRPICEVKQGQVRLVLAWGTSWEVRMLYIFALFALFLGFLDFCDFFWFDLFFDLSSGL